MSAIASRAKRSLLILERLVGVLEQPGYESIGISASEAVDILGRFKIWAANIGAFQDINIKSSLEFRVRDAPKIASQITELLDELTESLDDIYPIVSRARENRTGALHEAEIDPSTLLLETNEDTENEKSDEEELSEVREIFASIEDAISNLFRFSIIIRNNTNRDRYAKAAAAAIASPFDNQFDICHVEHKFPALAGRDQRWLSERLGKAITQRRQYLKYCREHHDKTARVPQNPDPVTVQANTFGSSSVMPARLIPVATSDYSKPTSTLAPTQASTLILTSGQAIEEEVVEEIQSQTSYATSTDEESSNATLSVIKVEEVSKGLSQFECPYCWQIQNARSQKAWKKHVLSDLKPYVCTFENCELKLFSDRHTWFSHELKDHRQEWRCYFCSHNPFCDADKYKRHLASRHPESLVEDQVPALLEMSQKALAKLSPADCPFCDDWEQRLRSVNPHIAAAEALAVTPSQFQHHVGAHMEQLALFAIPRGYTEEGGADSGNAAPQVNSNASSSINSEANSTMARQLRLCEEIMTELIEQRYSDYLSEAIAFPPFYLWLDRERTKILPLSMPEIVQKLESGEYHEADSVLFDMKVLFALLDLTHASRPHEDLCSLFYELWENKIGNSYMDRSRYLEQELRRKLGSAMEMSKKQIDPSSSAVPVTMRMLEGETFTRSFDKAASMEYLYRLADCYELINRLPAIQLPPLEENYQHKYHFMLTLAGNNSPGGRCRLDPNISIGEITESSTDFVVLNLGAEEHAQVSGVVAESYVGRKKKGTDISSAQNQWTSTGGASRPSSHDNHEQHMAESDIEIGHDGEVLDLTTSKSIVADSPGTPKSETNEDQWAVAKAAFVVDLTLSERTVFRNATLDNILFTSEKVSIRTGTLLRGASKTLTPLLSAIGSNYTAMQTISDVVPSAILGCLRVALAMSMEYKALFDKVVNTLGVIGNKFPELALYVSLFDVTSAQSHRFKQAASDMLLEIVIFCTTIKRKARLHQSNPITQTVLAPFASDQEFDKAIDRFSQQRARLDDEATILHVTETVQREDILLRTLGSSWGQQHVSRANDLDENEEDVEIFATKFNMERAGSQELNDTMPSPGSRPNSSPVSPNTRPVSLVSEPVSPVPGTDETSKDSTKADKARAEDSLDSENESQNSVMSDKSVFPAYTTDYPDADLWTREHITYMLSKNDFSDDWQRTFQALQITGSDFLALGRRLGLKDSPHSMHAKVFPRLALECKESGTGWRQDIERLEGKRLRRLIRGLVVQGKPVSEDQLPMTPYPSVSVVLHDSDGEWKTYSNLRKGDIVTIIRSEPGDWFLVQTGEGSRGVPSKLLSPPAPPSLQFLTSSGTNNKFRKRVLVRSTNFENLDPTQVCVLDMDLDSGSDLNWVAEEVARWLEAKILPLPNPFHVATTLGENILAQQYTFLFIRDARGGHTRQTRFCIAPGEVPFDILLGRKGIKELQISFSNLHLALTKHEVRNSDDSTPQEAQCIVAEGITEFSESQRRVASGSREETRLPMWSYPESRYRGQGYHDAVGSPLSSAMPIQRSHSAFDFESRPQSRTRDVTSADQMADSKKSSAFKRITNRLKRQPKESIPIRAESGHDPRIIGTRVHNFDSPRISLDSPLTGNPASKSSQLSLGHEIKRPGADPFKPRVARLTNEGVMMADSFRKPSEDSQAWDPPQSSDDYGLGRSYASPAPDANVESSLSTKSVNRDTRERVSKMLTSAGNFLGNAAAAKEPDKSQSDIEKSFAYPNIPGRYQTTKSSEVLSSTLGGASSNTADPKNNHPTIIVESNRYACSACGLSTGERLGGYECGHLIHESCYEKASGCPICMEGRDVWEDGEQGNK